MDIRGMDEESVVFNLSGENYTARCSPLINTIKAPILSSNGVSVNDSVVNSVDGGSYRYVLRNRFIVVINCESGITEIQKIVLVSYFAQR